MLTSTTSLPPGHTETWQLNHELSLRNAPGSVPHSRHYVTGTLENWNFRGQILDDAKIVTSGLVTNAYRACQRDRTVRLCQVRPMTLVVRSNFTAIVVEVHDPTDELPQLRDPQFPADGILLPGGGWGLKLVSLLTESWGFYRTDGGKAVWASFTRY